MLVLAEASRAREIGDAVGARYQRETGTGGEALIVRASAGAVRSARNAE